MCRIRQALKKEFVQDGTKGPRKNNNSFFVRALKPLGYLPTNAESFVDRQRAFAQPLRQRFAFDKLHNDEAFAFRLFEAIDRRDIGMIERRQKLRARAKIISHFAAGTRNNKCDN